ncbi:DUF4136 domain-containing protein [Sphingomonas solaris]|uniref:DUF4136 domain-containing protein n=1 Tax=Alterirhizorhabdus solaris TaxID=2529389 RepID=A0A558QS12_9SPHN|nr:DUF4136 domain-containing protein [Sphingomonas solaris]TVV69941.1 DUF4136 domain-containing protein [Sphingomonas solaris]
MLFRRAILIGSALAVAGCTTAGQAPVQVTRFHLGAPVATGRVSVEPADKVQAESLEFQSYARAVEGELGRIGFQVVPNVPNSELVAAVTVFRGSRETAPAQSPFSVGLGGGTFGGGRGGGIGLGGGVSFPIGKGRSREVVLTELSVQLKRRSEGTVIWEGRARTEQRLSGNAADSTATVARLANALFAGFPGESGRTITVK